MGLLSLVLAVYGAALSTALGLLAWRRDRNAVRVLPRFVRGEGHSRLELTVLNDGFRPIALSSAHFVCDDGNGYLPALDSELGLPTRLEPRDTLTVTFDALDITPDTVAFVIDTHTRDHRHTFDPAFRTNWQSREEHTG